MYKLEVQAGGGGGGQGSKYHIRLAYQIYKLKIELWPEGGKE